jgi:hypothetical protein
MGGWEGAEGALLARNSCMQAFTTGALHAGVLASPSWLSRNPLSPLLISAHACMASFPQAVLEQPAVQLGDTAGLQLSLALAYSIYSFKESKRMGLGRSFLKRPPALLRMLPVSPPTHMLMSKTLM